MKYVLVLGLVLGVGCLVVDCRAPAGGRRGELVEIWRNVKETNRFERVSFQETTDCSVSLCTRTMMTVVRDRETGVEYVIFSHGSVKSSAMCMSRLWEE